MKIICENLVFLIAIHRANKHIHEEVKFSQSYLLKQKVKRENLKISSSLIPVLQRSEGGKPVKSFHTLIQMSGCFRHRALSELYPGFRAGVISNALAANQPLSFIKKSP